MSADRELLELAAKAAGFSFEWSDRYECYQVWRAGDKIKTFWQPLLDDGQALRLAIDLDIDLCKPPVGNAAAWDQPDRYAVKRRAIVTAAAEIGRCMP